jgi:type II secretory pathway pseudopilin PulG
MFKIIGGDGQEYGPISVEQIQQWLREGRANTQTKVLREGTMDWRTIGEIPELMAPALYLPTQTDGKAIGSLVCGIISLVILPILASIPAVILGHMSRTAIRKSMGRLTGDGIALAGLIMGYISLAFFGFIAVILIVATIAIPSLLRSRQVANEAAAVANLRTINTAEVTYLSTSRGNYGDLDALISAGLLDERFDSTVSGYTFHILSDGGDYTAIAQPTSQNVGRFGYYSTPDGVVRYSLEESLAPTDMSGKAVP